MKKIFVILICFLIFPAYSEALKGGVTEEYIPEGFFGSWGVISKLKSATTPEMFNFESRDVWMLSGYGNTLILQNLESGARSEIIVKDKSLDGKTLKFEREKVTKENNRKVIYKETVEFVLLGNNFKGEDNYNVQKYDINNKLIKNDTAKYSVSGVRISGTNP